MGGDSPDENTYRNDIRQFVEVEKPEEITEHKQDRFTFSLDTHYLLLLPLLLLHYCPVRYNPIAESPVWNEKGSRQVVYFRVPIGGSLLP